MAKPKWKLTCGNCGSTNIRDYIPQYFKCRYCGETSYTDEVEELKE